MSAVLDNFALQFLPASLSCLLVGLGALGLLSLAGRYWPAVASQRAPVLLAQAVVAGALLLVAWPHSAQLSLLPAIQLEAAPPMTAPQLFSAPETAAAGSDDGAAAASTWLLRLAQAWLLIYLAGLSWQLVKAWRARRALRCLLGFAERLAPAALQAHPGLSAAQLTRIRQRRLAVWETAAAVSPMLIGVQPAQLLLPQHLRNFSVQQQQLIVEHELTHLRRRDPFWLGLSLGLQSLLWFNPCMRQLTVRLGWAQEIGCDQVVLHGRPAGQRQAYAAALLAQLKLQQFDSVALGFGTAHGQTLAARMRWIRQDGAAALGWLARCILGSVLLGVLAASVLLRPALAWRSAEPGSQAESVASQPLAWQAPLAQPRVSNFYGSISPFTGATHGGIDFAAARGTPVLASAAGTVIASSDLYDGQPKYGKVIVLAHDGHFSSLYAHLDQRRVAVGETVQAGQVLGWSGASGKVTGPHLHFEVWRDGRRVDPETLLDGLAANATRNAQLARSALHKKS